MLKWFMERMVERIVPIIAKSFATTVETLHALGQAEQQSELEEAARRYEAEGKIEIATSLRRCATQLPSNDPAAQAVEIFENVAQNGQRLLPPEQRPSGTELSRMPDLGNAGNNKRKRKPSGRADSPGS